MKTEEEVSAWHKQAWWKVGPGAMCPRCGEDHPGMVTRVQTSDRDQHYCAVCSFSWPELSRKSYDEARANPDPCRCGRLVTRPDLCDGPPCPFDKRVVQRNA